jgi:hypothetical protein
MNLSLLSGGAGEFFKFLAKSGALRGARHGGKSVWPGKVAGQDESKK